MIKIVLFLFILFNGCAIKAPKNDWQIKSTNAFNSYKKNFLKDNDAIAKSDLSRAIRHASQSADLTQLAKVYLGSCALNISVGIHDECSKYQDIADLNANNKLEAYSAFLRLSIQETQIKLLPLQYQNFARALIKKDFSQANQEILKMKQASSSYLSAVLIQKNLQKTSLLKIINTASLHGHKKFILYFLSILKDTSSNPQEITNIQRKISILKSN